MTGEKGSGSGKPAHDEAMAETMHVDADLLSKAGGSAPSTPSTGAAPTGAVTAAAASEDPGQTSASSGRPPRPSFHDEQDPFKPGTVIDGYRLIRPLGAGAMGLVHLAVDERLERAVAIKLIRPTHTKSRLAVERFLAEARAMARIKHVNVVEIYAFGEHQGTPFFVMEYIPGTTVADWLRQRPGVPAVDEALGILDQVCRGVSAIHAAGAVHRDIKATNVLIGTAFRVAVADLGLARLMDAHRAGSEGISGTPAYMAPEVAAGKIVASGMEPRADVYSLAVLAFQLLTGRLPFETRDAIEMMTLHLSEPPPAPSTIRPDLPKAFDEVLLKALAKDPARRTASAKDFERALLDARQASVTPDEKMRILIADDDPDFCILAADTLAYAFPKAEIEVTESGDAALIALEREPASLAIIDLDMPGLNGIELTTAIRTNPRSEMMPIVVATGTGGAPDWRQLQALGADGFLVKPIDPVALIAVARRAVGHTH